MKKIQKRGWIDGTQVLAVLIDRFAPGSPVRVTRQDVEQLKLRTILPIEFRHVDGDTIELRLPTPERISE